MKALVIISLLGVVAMMADVLRFRKLLMPLVVFGLAGALGTLFAEWNTDATYFNNMAYFNNYAIAFSAALIIISLLWLLMGADFFTNEASRSEHAALILFTLAGGITMVSFNNLTLFFIGLEILSISLYVLAASNKKELRSNEAGLKYLLMGAFATGFLLFGIALIYGATGSFSLDVIAGKLSEGVVNTLFVKAGVLMILVSLLFKVSAAPFHFWAPDVYEGAPTPVTAFMATVVKTAAFAAFYRMFASCFPALYQDWSVVVAFIAALTMLAGNILAVYQKSLKRMLAYSSIAHAGYMLMAIVAFNEVSAGALFLYAIAYSLGSLGIFAVLQGISAKSGNESVEALNGLGKRQPIVGVFLSLIMFSMAGIPPMAGFFAKYYLFFGAFTAGYSWLLLVAILSSLIGVFYYFRVIYALFKDEQSADGNLSLGGAHLLMLILAGLGSLLIGLYPTWIHSLLS